MSRSGPEPNPLWNQLLDDASLLGAVLDRQGRVLFASRSLGLACGWGEGSAEGRSWPQHCLRPEAEAPEAHARLQGWLAGASPAGVLEAELPPSSGGSARLVRWHARPLPATPGSTAALALLGSDITAQRAGEARLRRLADFYRALSDMGKAIVGLDDPRQLYRAICHIAVESGHATMAWIGLVDQGRVVPVAWGGPAQQYTEGLDIRAEPGGAGNGALGPTAYAVTRGDTYICNDFHHDPRTGRWRDRAAQFGIKASAAFPFRRAGQVVGTLNLYFPDTGAFDDALIELLDQMVTDLSFALDHIDQEAARAQAERAARERESQLAGIVATAMDAIITVNARFEIVVFNEAAARMFGVPPEQAIGQSIDRFIPDAHRVAHRQHLARYATQGVTSRRMGHTRELSGQRANGEVFPMEASISRAGEGDRLLMTVMARDVTQLRQAEKARLAHAAAEAANRAKTEFLSRISHELRTPLNAVLGFAQLMREDEREPLGPRHHEQLGLVLQAGEHLRTLIDEMLDVSRIETGRIPIQLRDFELCELLDGVLQMSAPHALQCGVRLEAAYSPDCTMLLRSDPARLRQVMLNLVSNAIKYNRPQGWVRLELQREARAVHIVVRDNGLGMSDEQKTQLFQPFNRLGREHSAVQGTGIGLVLVRQLVGLMGGELTVDSRPGHGTAVRVSLPATEARPPAAQAQPEKDADAAQPAPSGVVLYIEDNPINAILVEQLLARWPGVQLVIAVDGSSGLERARALQPDVVLLDMQLPDLAGLEVLRQLKADPALRARPVVALSASAMPEDVAASRAGGAADYWTKPIDFDRFMAGMRGLLPRGPSPGLP